MRVAQDMRREPCVVVLQLRLGVLPAAGVVEIGVPQPVEPRVIGLAEAVDRAGCRIVRMRGAEFRLGGG